MKIMKHIIYTVEYGSLYFKLAISFLASFFLTVSKFFLLHSTVTSFFRDRVLDHLVPDIDVMIILAIAIGIDFASGILRWWKKDDHHDPLEVAKDVLMKIFIVWAGITLFDGMSDLKSMKAHPDIQSYFSLLGELTVLIYIAISAFGNLHYLSKGKFPPAGIMGKFKTFEKTGNVSELLDKGQSLDSSQNSSDGNNTTNQG